MCVGCRVQGACSTVTPVVHRGPTHLCLSIQDHGKAHAAHDGLVLCGGVPAVAGGRELLLVPPPVLTQGLGGDVDKAAASLGRVPPEGRGLSDWQL